MKSPFLITAVVILLAGCGERRSVDRTDSAAEPLARADATPLAADAELHHDSDLRDASPAQPVDDAAAGTVGALTPEPQVDGGDSSAQARPTLEVLDLLRAAETRVALSSVFGGDLRQAERLFDGDPGSAWNSATGDLEDAWIEIAIPEEAEALGLEIVVGVSAQTPMNDLFTASHRIRRVRISHDGEVLTEVNLSIEERGFQTITFPQPTRGGVIRLEVVELVPGTRIEFRETCVGELRLLGRLSTPSIGINHPALSIGNHLRD